MFIIENQKFVASYQWRKKNIQVKQNQLLKKATLKRDRLRGKEKERR